LAGGTSAFVALARAADARQVVLKVVVPDPDLDGEAGLLARAAGRGYVALLAHDPDRRALLLEALGEPLSRSGRPPRQQVAIMCDLLGQAWTVPREGDGAPAYDKATSLAVLVQENVDRLGGPCPEAVVARALEYADRRAAAFDPDRCVVVHGDAATANALRVLTPRPGAEAGFLLVDPSAFVGDPAYDLGVALRDWCPQLLAAPDAGALARQYCRWLAEGSGQDARAVWEWGYLERVSTGLYALALGADELARPMLATAELLLDDDGGP
jgi:streptomycin 6-kinase